MSSGGFGTVGSGTVGSGTVGSGLGPLLGGIGYLDGPLQPFASGDAPMLLGRPDAKGKNDTLGPFFPSAACSPPVRATMALAEFALQNECRDLKVDKPDNSEDNLKKEIRKLLDLIPARAGRAAEILAQDQDIASPFLRILMAEGPGRPGIQALVTTGLEIGRMVSMHFKREYNRGRPVQVYPGLFPIIPTPPHPSYPSGHALQAHLIAHLLAHAAGKAALGDSFALLLDFLADRIAKNREVAGVHFESDSTASEKLSKDLWPLIVRLKTVAAMIDQATAELGGVRVGGKPAAPPKPDSPPQP